jgi:imidazolonepropionase
MGLTVEETLTAMTLNAAASVLEAGTRGTLEPGKRADVVLLDAPALEHLVYHWGVNLVSDVLVAGERVVGGGDLLGSRAS